jgi:predicted CXXCH cytochrome family protein
MNAARPLFPLAVALLLTAPALAAPPDSTSSAGRCGACHPAERVKFEQGRHAPEGVTCVSCHGGDDRALVESVAHGGTFRGHLSRTAIVAMCASCHSDEQRMRPYNLPVDQLALYQTSGHGQRLAKGDTRVAVCSDCHGAHDILAASDPASRVYVVNVPRTCGQCHGRPELMKDDPHAGEVYGEYVSSVHAKALLEKGNLRAPTCTSCHGVHGAAPPDVGDVGKVCGQCHTAERRYFAAGPHGAKMASRKLAECASCHGDHAVPASDPARLATQCLTCHGPDSPQAKLGAAMFADYQAARKEIDAAAAIIARADAVPLPTEDYKARLEEARTLLSEAMPAAHSVREDLVASFTSRARSVGHEIQSEVGDKLTDLRWRYVGLALFWFYLVLTVLVLRRFQGRGARNV